MSDAPKKTVWIKPALLGIGAGTLFGSALAGSISGLAVYFARQVLTPKPREEDLEILTVIPTAEPSKKDAGIDIILPATEETIIDGTYSLFFDGGDSHARIGKITSYHPADRTVQRRVEHVYRGTLTPGKRGWFGGMVYDTPADVGVHYESIDLPTELGPAPAWLVPAPVPGNTWAIMVHGRGVTRQETLRAIPVAQKLGLTSLHISYRNDGEAPPARDGRYGLGLTEWRDVDLAIQYAITHGAKQVVLFGWSMGGAICLQSADQSPNSRFIAAMVLDGPVVDWVNVLAHQARINRLPSVIGKLGRWLISNKAGVRLTGLAAPLDFKVLDWVARAEQLRIPTLILHSVDDTYVPAGPSESLAKKNPELVSFERYTQAGHTREWNYDRKRWSRDVTRWLSKTLRTRRGPETSELKIVALG